MKNIDYNRKISEIEKKISDHNHDKYITTSEFNNLTTENFNARLAQANLVTKTKHLLVGNDLRNLKKFDAAYFRGKECFSTYGLQFFLVFQPMS